MQGSSIGDGRTSIDAFCAFDGDDGVRMATSASQRDLQRVILTYTLRQKLYQTAADRCREWLAKRSDPQLNFWSNVAIGLTGRRRSAFRGLI